MAKTTRTETARRSKQCQSRNRGMVFEGNTVRQTCGSSEKPTAAETISGKTAAESKPQVQAQAGTGTKARNTQLSKKHPKKQDRNSSNYW